MATQVLDLGNKDFLQTDMKRIRDGTPANAVVRFFFNWKTRDLNSMLEVCRPQWRARGQAKEKLELFFGDIFLIGMKISKIKMMSPFQYNIIMQVGFKKRGSSKVIIGLVTAETMSGGDGTWYVNPLSLLKGFGIYKKIFISEENMA